MNFLRAIAASLLSLICTLSVSGFITLATLHTTLLNRQEVGGWLQDSGVYKNAVDTILTTDPTVQDQVADGSVSQSAIKSALTQTFTPGFVQQQSEKMLDSTYDWLNGKQPMILLDINATGLKDTFVRNVAAALEPQLAQLPACNDVGQINANNPTCLPHGTTAQQLAQSFATDAGNQLSLFQQPITNDSIAKANTESGQTNDGSPLTSPHSSTQGLPRVTADVKSWLLWLPIIAVLSGALSILLSHDRLKAGKILARRLTFGLLVTLLIGLIVATVGRSISLSSYVSGNPTIIKNIVDPIIHQAAPAIGNRLALVSGIAGGLTLVLWIMFQTLWENRERAKLLASPEKETPQISPTKPVAEPSHKIEKS